MTEAGCGPTPLHVGYTDHGRKGTPRDREEVCSGPGLWTQVELGSSKPAITWGCGRWRPLPGTLGRPSRFAPVRGQRGAQPRGSAHPQSIHCLLGDRTDGVKKDDSLFHSRLARASAPRGRQAGEAPQSLGLLLVPAEPRGEITQRGPVLLLRGDKDCRGLGGWGVQSTWKPASRPSRKPQPLPPHPAPTGEPPPCSGWAAGGSGRAQARIPGATHWTSSPRPPPPRRPSPLPSACKCQQASARPSPGLSVPIWAVESLSV